MRALAHRADVRWIVFGFGSDALPPADAPNVTRLGAIAREAVQDTARALDLFVAPYRDGLTMRRGGAMLGLLNGLPLVSATGPLFDEQLAACAACEPDEAAFVRRVTQLVDDAAARTTWAQRAAAARPLASIETLADHVVRDLG
jgi:glycosyltransferase involved in cell wall biosynthesis